MAAAAAPAPPAKSKCDTFLELSDRSTDEFTIRNIDETIHRHIMKFDEESFSEFEIVDKSPGAYRKKQYEIIEQIKGCEVPIFNDPRIVYLGHRPHLSGITGALSNILTGTFYYLYYHVLQIPEIQINVKADLLTLFHTGLAIDFSKLPPKDNKIIQSILQILLEKAKTEGIELFTPDWWDSLVPRLRSIITEIKESPTMWRVFQKLFDEDGVSIFYYAPYEDTVDYVKHDVREYEDLLNVPANFDKINKQLTKVRNLFTIEAEPAMNNNMAALLGLMGGSRRSIKKMTHRQSKHKQKARRKNGQRKTVRRRA